MELGPPLHLYGVLAFTRQNSVKMKSAEEGRQLRERADHRGLRRRPVPGPVEEDRVQAGGAGAEDVDLVLIADVQDVSRLRIA